MPAIMYCILVNFMCCLSILGVRTHSIFSDSKVWRLQGGCVSLACHTQQTFLACSTMWKPNSKNTSLSKNRIWKSIQSKIVLLESHRKQDYIQIVLTLKMYCIFQVSFKILCSGPNCGREKEN